VEILVVVAVIGIVAAIAMVALMNALDKAKQKSTMADMRTVSRAIEAYRVDTGFVPDSSGGILPLSNVLIPYQSSVLPTSDHWDNVYGYVADANGNYTLESFGKDGIDGVDITYATRFSFDDDIIIYNGMFIASPE
jgi:general secretion pathway protein G